MTQLQPPPFPPHSGPQEYHAAPYSPPRWSAAAIGGFVLSLLGFLGITAVLGLIFGIVGIFTTSGGRRRGMGLAIAAIPISLVTGVFSVFLLLGVLMVTRAAAVPLKLQAALGSGAPTVVESAKALREIGSSAFNSEVTAEALQAWIAQINTKHGKLTSATLDTRQVVSETPDGRACLNLTGSFVNGSTAIRLIYKAENAWSLHFDDIEIGDSSPRGPSKNPTPSKLDPVPVAP